MHVESRGAWSKRAKQGRLLGMSEETKGYRIYNPEDRVVVVSQHEKNISTLSDEQNESLLRLVEREMEETKEERTRLPPAPEQMVTRGRKAKQVMSVESVLVDGGEGDGMDEEDVARIMNLGVTGNGDDLGKYRDCEDPKTFRQAMKLPTTSYGKRRLMQK